MLRTLATASLMIAVLSPLVAHADAYSYADNQESRAERARLYPHPVRTARQHLALIKALTQTRVVESYTQVGAPALFCGGESSVTYVFAKMADGRVCVSPAPTSCESKTVSCD